MFQWHSISWNQARSHRGASRCTAPTANLAAPTGICKISKANMLIRSELREDHITKLIQEKKAQLQLAQRVSSK